ncbi:SGNH/GDSL hydrolase family protein [Fictibacillus sp. BK138]|uniref:SGNH/GDSL hydrolase family protein n=1 Tax=Fictibacillus sp. BK138 TaxID=2512121 RepID=UPI001028EA56|nr:SGNH/GDSL hydrolase family protein [Fictibacillus sp. BK138]RZT21260.1 lysophospholipase L1-like esterase [Fictibacillus sp. BK138]
MKIIFIGDSITASNKNTDPERLGNGYVRMIKEVLPEDVKVINKGVNGHRVTDLAFRWERDVIDLEPDLLTVSIGINDVWRQLDSPDLTQVDVSKFEEIYRELLSQLPATTKLVLMEPTIIKENPQSQGNQMLIPYVEVVRKLAVEFDAVLVPTHDVFIDHLTKKPDVSLTTDGVHMRKKGNELMAKAWLKAAESIIEQ